VFRNSLNTLLVKENILQQAALLLNTRLDFKTTSRLSFVMGIYGFYFKLFLSKNSLFKQVNIRKVLLKKFSFVNSVVTKKNILRDFIATKYYYLNEDVLQKSASNPGFNFYYTSQSLLFRKYATPSSADFYSSTTLLNPLDGSTLVPRSEPDRVSRIRFKPGYSTL